MADTLAEATEVMEREHAAPGLADQRLVDMYYTMLLSRTVSETMWALQRQGRIIFVISGEGHEAAQVGSALALVPGRDFFFLYYRDTAAALALGVTAVDIMLGAFNRAADPSSGGRQMPCFFSDARLKIVSGTAPVATQIPHAVGVALAARVRKQRLVSFVTFGDGAASKGDFHESLNFAGVHRLPVIFFCENNSLAISVPAAKQAAIANLAERAAGYGFPGFTVDGMDPLACYRVTRQAAERALHGLGPTLIEAKVSRFSPHTSNDDDRRYRTPQQLAEEKKKDPIPRFGQLLHDWGLLTPARQEEMRQRAKQEVEAAVRAAEQSPLPDPKDLVRHVYASQEQSRWP